MNKLFKKYLIYLDIKLNNLFKYKHGYEKNCNVEKSKKCPVCSTPWPQELLIKSNVSEYEKIYFEPTVDDELSKIYGNFYGGYLYLPKIKNENLLHKS